jgi:hypothetical protein
MQCRILTFFEGFTVKKILSYAAAAGLFASFAATSAMAFSKPPQEPTTSSSSGGSSTTTSSTSSGGTSVPEPAGVALLGLGLGLYAGGAAMRRRKKAVK